MPFIAHRCQSIMMLIPFRPQAVAREFAMNWISITVFTVGAVLYGVYGAEDLWRQAAMRRLARKHGFSYARERLPQALSLYGTPFAHRRFTWNVLDKPKGGHSHLVVFDCQVGEDKAALVRTVIAIRTGSAILDATKLDTRMKVENSGGWSIVYLPQEVKCGLTPLKELRSQLDRIESSG